MSTLTATQTSTLVDNLVTKLSQNMSSSSQAEVDTLRAMVRDVVEQSFHSDSKAKATRTKKTPRVTPSKLNPYHLYIKCNMPSVQASVTDPKQRMTALSNNWRETSTEDRQEYTNYANAYNTYVSSHESQGLSKDVLEHDALVSTFTGSRFASLLEKRADDTKSAVQSSAPAPAPVSAPAPVQVPVATPAPTPVSAPASSSTTKRVTRGHKN